MSFPRYPEYKDSGVEWLGDLPLSWNVSRLGFEAWVRARLGWKGLKAEEYVHDGVIFLATPNIKEANIDFDNVNYISEDRYEESPEIKLTIGDVLLAKDGSTLGTVNVVKALPRPATVNSSIAVITPHTSITGPYLRYVFNSSYMEQVIQKTKGGMGVPHLFQADLNKFYIPLPPVPDQEAVTSFLDRETAKIDALVAEQEQLIILLKEKRQAVISHAVTKGLDPNVPMKDSGIEWLGEVPEHWNVLPMKRVLAERLMYGANEASDDDTPDNPRFVRITDINQDGSLREETFRSLPLEVAEHYLLFEGDILLARSGATVGKSFIYRTAWGICCFAGYLIRARANLNILQPDYLYFCCQSSFYWQFIGSEQIQATIQNVSAEKYGDLVIPCPPLDEQCAISRIVAKEVSMLDELVANAVNGIQLLQERRGALILAAVTGKIDVRQLSAVEVA